jgi:hypothetical protein
MPPAICIRCLEPGEVSLLLKDERTFNCASCKTTFTADEVRELLADLHAAWAERLKWVDTHPGAKKE